MNRSSQPIESQVDFEMRILILSSDERIADYSEFAKALSCFGAESLCASSSKYCFLSKTGPLHVIPTPRFLKLVKSFNPDFLLTDQPFYVPQLAKLVGRRSLFHLRGNPWSEFYVDAAMYPSFFDRMYTQYLAAIKDRSIKATHLVLPNSRWLEKQVKEHLQDCPTRVLYVGIDPRKWSPSGNLKGSLKFNVKRPALVGVFQFNQYEKISGLMKFIRVVRQMKDVNFYFAGTGPYLELVKQECPSNMFLVGKLSGIQIREFLEMGDVFVHPSGLDALPRCVKEAALMEKPIVASNEGGIPEIVLDEQTGYLCNIDDTDQWVKRIRFLLDNPGVAEEFGKNARKFVEETFDWKGIASRLLGIIRDYGEKSD